MTFALCMAVWMTAKLQTGTPQDVLSYIDFAFAELDKSSPWWSLGYREPPE